MSFNVSWDYKVEQLHGDVNPQGYYVYCFWDGDTPFYVGLGKKSRWRQHFHKSEKTLLKNNPHKYHKMRKMAQEGRVIGVQIVAHRLEKEEAQKLEVELIRNYGRKCDGGPLTNMSSGGESGASGLKLSEEVRKQRSLALRGKNTTVDVELVKKAKLLHYYRGFSPKDISKLPEFVDYRSETISCWISKNHPNFSYILPDLPVFSEIYDEKKAEAVKLHAKGFNYAEVARILGVCRILVARACKEAE